MASIGTSEPPLRPSGKAPGILPQYSQYAESTAASFKTFTPRNPEQQAKYDAMSPTWKGVDSTNAAIARGDYKLDTVASTTYTPSVKEPPKSDWFCVVQ
jgi:hypothetical protein